MTKNGFARLYLKLIFCEILGISYLLREKIIFTFGEDANSLSQISKGSGFIRLACSRDAKARGLCRWQRRSPLKILSRGVLRSFRTHNCVKCEIVARGEKISRSKENRREIFFDKKRKFLSQLQK
jgi:hypothetical protein